MRTHRLLPLVLASALLPGCSAVEALLPSASSVDRNGLAPQIANEAINSNMVCPAAAKVTGNVATAATNAPATEATKDPGPSDLQQKFDKTMTGFDTTLSRLPKELHDNAAVQSLVLGAQLHTARSIHTVNTLARARGMLTTPTQVATHTRHQQKVDQLESQNLHQGLWSEHDFKLLGKLLANKVLRRTKASPVAATAPTPAAGQTQAMASATTNENDSAATSDETFWARLGEYYSQFYQGKYVTYMGAKFDAPTISLTITDTELANVVVVFFDYMFDAALATPIWTALGGSDGKTPTYYPGGTTNEPTSLGVFGRTPQQFASPIDGDCGMTQMKAEAVGVLAQQFSTAASNEIGLIVGTIGGINGGSAYDLGFLGKLSIGDNKLFLSLIEAAVSEVAARWTVQLSYPILENLNFNALDSSLDVTAVAAASVQAKTTASAANADATTKASTATAAAAAAAADPSNQAKATTAAKSATDKQTAATVATAANTTLGKAKTNEAIARYRYTAPFTSTTTAVNDWTSALLPN